MNVAELQIGDWVQNPLGLKATVHSIRYIPKDICDDFGGYYIVRLRVGEGGWQDLDEGDVKPIPITPEIIEKNGFKIDSRATHWKKYVFVEDVRRIPQTVIQFSFYEDMSADTLFKCWTKPESCDGENNIHICDLKYVHELQHAIGLCGIKKDIVL